MACISKIGGEIVVFAEKTDFKIFVDSIVHEEVFWKSCYYCRCMKKLPHGGIAHMHNPNIFLWYYPIQTFFYFSKGMTVPYFLRPLYEHVLEAYSQHNIKADEILDFCFRNEDPNWCFIAGRILHLKDKYMGLGIAETFLWNAIDSGDAISIFFEYGFEDLIYAFVCRLIEASATKIIDLADIEKHEDLQLSHNKYGLSDITGAKFLRQGYILNGIYYLYSIFFDTSIGDAKSQMPLTALFLDKLQQNHRILMRGDGNLSVPADKIFTTTTWDAQQFRGMHLDFANIESAIHKKEIIVHYNPETLNKVLLTIKKDHDEKGLFYHIVVEQLWNPDRVYDDIVITNLVHAKYYPALKYFLHIDFEVIQYNALIYAEKYNDALASSSIPIDKYGDQKYKIWCVEGDGISSEDWCHLVHSTLDEPFRSTFLEMFSI